MAKYYFDIETYPTVNPDTAKIITIQFQRINGETGKPEDELVILKEWESSEEQIVSKFYNKFFRKDISVWDFIPVGYYLNFEWEFLIAKFDKYLGIKLSSRNLHYYRPHIDLRPVGVLINGGKFKGSGLDKITSKPHNGEAIKKWYENKEYDKIENYIVEETTSFLEFLQKIIELLRKYELPEVKE